MATTTTATPAGHKPAKQRPTKPRPASRGPTGIQGLLTHLDEFERAPTSRGHDLRLDLADLVLRGLDDKGWTQKQLAAAAGMKESFVTRIVHAQSNCTFDVAGRLCAALGVDPRLSAGGRGAARKA